MKNYLLTEDFTLQENEYLQCFQSQLTGFDFGIIDAENVSEWQKYV